MPTIKVIRREEIKVKYLLARCGVRYWEDATVNGVVDTDGTLIPLRQGDDWEVMIDMDTGRIRNWPEGVAADIHYKVCDDGAYALLDDAMNTIARIEGYVPSIMCPKDEGFGDYVIMDIGPDGVIANWYPHDLREFERQTND